MKRHTSTGDLFSKMLEVFEILKSFSENEDLLIDDVEFCQSKVDGDAFLIDYICAKKQKTNEQI